VKGYLEGNLRFRPERLHQPQSLGEPGYRTGRIDLEGGEHSVSPSCADAYLDAASAQLVQSAQALGEVDGAVCSGVTNTTQPRRIRSVQAAA
jgi:hypothetical protein